MKRNWRNNWESTRDEERSTNGETPERNFLNATGLSLVAVIFGVGLLLAGCGNKEEAHQHDTYTCPMHPTVVSDKPGTCPVCGMALVKKGPQGEGVKITEDLASLIKSPNEIVVASIKTVKAEYKKMPVFIEGQGVVTYDTRNIYTIPARIGGRLEKVYLRYPFQQVKKGQKVVEIYSPELLAAQRELLFLIENDTDNQTLIQGAKQKLSLLGATEYQIQNLIKAKDTQNTFTIYSPYDGYVMTTDLQAPSAPAVSDAPSTPGSGMSDGMVTSSSSSVNNNPMTSNSTPGMLIREGNYVSSGETLFKVVNNAALRVELNIPASQAASINRGSKVKLDFGDGNIKSATVDFVQPFFNEGQEFVTIRVYTKDIENLHIGHLVKAVIQGDSVEGLWIPKEAVLDLGLEKIVFIKDKEVLKPKKVVTGVRTDNSVEIRQGLSSLDEFAVNAQYLVDSESFIKTQR